MSKYLERILLEFIKERGTCTYDDIITWTGTLEIPIRRREVMDKQISEAMNNLRRKERIYYRVLKIQVTDDYEMSTVKIYPIWRDSGDEMWNRQITDDNFDFEKHLLEQYVEGINKTVELSQENGEKPNKSMGIIKEYIGKIKSVMGK